MSSETEGHKKLKKKVKEILERCKFQVDTEVHLDIDNDGNDDRSFDVCAICTLQNNDYMLVFECKDQKSITDIKKEVAAWKSDMIDIIKNKEDIKVLSSSDEKITDDSFKKLKGIKLCFVFTDKLDANKSKYQENILSKEGIVFWSPNAVKYFDKTSSTIEEWMVYELYREFNIFHEIQDTHKEKATPISQPGFPDMFLLGIHPGLLLKIGYVMRRTSNKPDAYQRIINKDRIQRISKFLSSKDVLLPNNIIIAFDNDSDVQKEFKYENGFLTFPIKYCSAWIIDGQHRIYGFIKTDYKNWTQESNEIFKLPVLAFRTLEDSQQNKTFVNINYNQKKIDPTLLCDLATVSKDLNSELTWPSLLVSELNKVEPWKGLVKISEFDTKCPVTLSSFSRYALLETLLGYNNKSFEYSGPLFDYAPFDTNIQFDHNNNQVAFKKQLNLLQHFFSVVKSKNKNIWKYSKEYALTKTTSTNALLLVLTRILEKYPDMKLNLNEYLEPLKLVNFKSEEIVKCGGGWKGFRNLANKIIYKLKERNKDSLKWFGKRKKR